MLTMESLADEIGAGTVAHGRRRVPRPPGPAGREAGHRSVLPRPRGRTTASRSATTCWPATSTWSRCPATGSPTGRAATATSVRWSIPAPSDHCRGTPAACSSLCDLLTMEGEPVEVSPRRMLRRQIERAAERGYEVRCATELEFYLFLDSFARGRRRSGGRTSFHMRAPSRTTSSSRRRARSTSSDSIRNQMLEAGIPIEYSKGEAGIGQHEINVTYGGRARDRPTGTSSSRAG